MGSKLTAAEREARRRLAVQRVVEGWSQKDVAAFLGVHPVTVNAWVRAHRAGGDEALKGKPHPGRTPALTSDSPSHAADSYHRLRPIDHVSQDGLPSRRFGPIIKE